MFETWVIPTAKEMKLLARCSGGLKGFSARLVSTLTCRYSNRSPNRILKLWRKLSWMKCLSPGRIMTCWNGFEDFSTTFWWGLPIWKLWSCRLSRERLKRTHYTTRSCRWGTTGCSTNCPLVTPCSILITGYCLCLDMAMEQGASATEVQFLFIFVVIYTNKSCGVLSEIDTSVVLALVCPGFSVLPWVPVHFIFASTA